MNKISNLLQRAEKLTQRSRAIIAIVMPDGGEQWRVIRNIWNGSTNRREETTHTSERAALNAAEATTKIIIDV